MNGVIFPLFDADGIRLTNLRLGPSSVISFVTQPIGRLEFGRGRRDLFTVNCFIYHVTILDYALTHEDALRLSQTAYSRRIRRITL